MMSERGESFLAKLMNKFYGRLLFGDGCNGFMQGAQLFSRPFKADLVILELCMGTIAIWGISTVFAGT